MNAELKPYALPRLRDLAAGASMGAMAGMFTSTWSVPASVFTVFFWLAIAEPAPLSEWSQLFGALLGCAVVGTFLGILVGGVLGIMAGGATFLVLYPFLPPERWRDAGMVMCGGFRNGATIGQILAGVLPILAVGPWAPYLGGWVGSLFPMDYLVFAWLALVPCGFVLGGFIHVACLIFQSRPRGEEMDL